MESFTSFSSKETKKTDKEPDEKKPEQKIDFSVVNDVIKKKKEQLSGSDNLSPQELAKIDLRIREGEKHMEDKMVVDGSEIVIPQLTIMDLRKAQIRSLESISGTELAQKMVDISRKKADPDKEIKLTPKERLMLSEVGIEENYWLVWFSLTKIKHPKLTGNQDKDRDWIGNLSNYDELVKTIRNVNALDAEGGKKVRFFRTH